MKKNIADKYALDVCLHIMEHSGYKARIMAANKLPDNGFKHELPPGIPISAVPIHCLPGCPKDWVRESGSYVIPVYPDVGIWFDWTMNDKYSIAIVPSVKGSNPITGQKMEGCQMEQYRDQCPVHKIPFAHGRYCEECKYGWSPQNYISYPNILWVDGWFQPDGTVRQFFYTDEVHKDVASALIGKENTMPAFGFAFFKCKNDIIKPSDRMRGVASIDNWTFTYSDNTAYINNIGVCKEHIGDTILYKGSTGPTGVTGSSGNSGVSGSEICYLSSTVSDSNVKSKLTKISAMNYACDSIKVLSEEEGRAIRPQMYEKNVAKEVSVGAGAAIAQALEVDTRPLSDYHEKPQALMRIYFCFEQQFKEIVERGGIKKLEEQEHGFLKGVPVGG